MYDITEAKSNVNALTLQKDLIETMKAIVFASNLNR